MIKRIFAFALLLFVMQQLHAQKWVEMMEDQSTNFYDVQKEFNKYFDGKEYERGNGWKQFKRWEYFMEPRVYPTGERFDPTIAWTEHLKFQQEYPNSQRTPAGNWAMLGPSILGHGIGRINGVMVDPNNSNVIYIGAPSGGCWKSTDGGNSWSTTTDNLPILGVSSIAIHQSNSNIVYIGTGDGDGADTYSMGVLKSLDGGSTWNTTGLNWTISQTRRIYKLIIDPTNPDILYAATNDGVYKTTDAAANWTLLFSDIINDVKFKPGNPNTLYATSDEFYKSTDGGSTWSIITSGLPLESLVNRAVIGVSPDNPNYVYFLCGKQSGSQFLGIYRSSDSGDNFSLRTDTPNMFGYNIFGNDNSGQSWYDMAIAVNPSMAEEVYIGGVNVWKSTDGGSNFTIKSYWKYPNLTGYTHADIHSLDMFGNELYCGSDGGIFHSSDFGNTWNDLTTGVEITQFYRLGCSATNSNLVIAGAQDNGTNLMSGTTNWDYVIGGDGMEALIDHSNANIMFGSSQKGTIKKSINGGGLFSTIINSYTTGESGGWVTPYVMDATNPNILFAGFENVWKTTNGGTSWNPISTWGGVPLLTLASAPSDPDYVYAGSWSTLMMTDDGGSNWYPIDAGLPAAAVTYIAVHPQYPQKIWVTLSGFLNGEKVYQSDNGGSTWSNYSGNLPNLPINCIVFQDGSDEGLYVGTDVGVYYRDSTLGNWQAFMDGLPNVMVSELEIQYAAGKIRAATFGRGLWESDTYTPTPTPPVALFTADKTVVCPGEQVQFTDQSSNALPGWQWQFPGGTPSSSTLQNPVITYNTVGFYDAKLTVSNGWGSDSLLQVAYIEVATPPATNAEVVEGFEAGFPPSGWNIDNPDNNFTWMETTLAGGFGLSPTSSRIDNLNNNGIGQTDALVTPAIDFSTVTQASLSFDVAYAKRGGGFSDTLAVYYTADCDNSGKTLLWLKGGDDLATAPETTNEFIPSATEWRKDSIDISAIYGDPYIKFLFENRSGWGNFMYLDNINIEGDGLLPVISAKPGAGDFIRIYPNPFEDAVYIDFQSETNADAKVQVYNAIGQLMETRLINSRANNKFDLSHLPSGMYYFKVMLNEEVFGSKVIKE